MDLNKRGEPATLLDAARSSRLVQITDNEPVPPPWTWDGFWLWAQTPLGATVVGTLLTALILWVVGLIYGKIKGASFWKALPVWLRRIAKWPLSLRIVTTRHLESTQKAGYERHKAEVEHERKAVRQPAWRVDQRGPFKNDDLFWLHNSGYPASDVSISCDDSEMVLNGSVIFTGPFGAMTGRQFEGKLTEKGIADGVTFHVKWTDTLGDHQSIDYHYPADRLLVNELETRDEAYARGRTDLQAEIDAQRAKPIIEPQWLLGYDAKNKQYIISNSAAGSTARDVKIDAAPQFFSFIGAPQWDDISVPADAEDPGLVGTRGFRGVPGDYGRSFGVKVSVYWTDENGERWERHEVPIHGTGRQF